MTARRNHPRMKHEYLSSYMQAQKNIKEQKVWLRSPARDDSSSRPPSVAFGDWRMDPKDISKSRRMDMTISQVSQKPIAEIPKTLFVDAPHVQQILADSRKLSGNPSKGNPYAKEIIPDVAGKKIAVFERIFTDVLPKYRPFAIAEFVRQEATWKDSLRVCQTGIWTHADRRAHSKRSRDPRKPRRDMPE